MSGAGLFGKIPLHGDFVARGTGGDTGRSFERWLQMANERLHEEKAALPPGPLGFIYRAPTATSLLVGVMVPSQDRVGRVFPLSLFHEIGAQSAPGPFAALPGALSDAVEELATIALRAAKMSKAELERRSAQAQIPAQSELAERLTAQQRRLESCSVATLLERLFPSGVGVYYAMSVFLRACETAQSNPIAQPVVFDAPATSDLELSFWLACAYTCLPLNARPPAAIWDVSSSRVLVAMGSPDSNMLNYLRGPHVQHRKLWGTLGSAPDANDRAKTRLPPQVAEAIDAAETMRFKEFVSTLAASNGGAESNQKGS